MRIDASFKKEGSSPQLVISVGSVSVFDLAEEPLSKVAHQEDAVERPPPDNRTLSRSCREAVD
jgi:hypothetical protein